MLFDNNLPQLREKTCAECGKLFIPAPEHIFRVDGKWFCKWTCFSHYKEKHPKAIAPRRVR